AGVEQEGALATPSAQLPLLSGAALASTLAHRVLLRRACWACFPAFNHPRRRGCGHWRGWRRTSVSAGREPTTARRRAACPSTSTADPRPGGRTPRRGRIGALVK